MTDNDSGSGSPSPRPDDASEPIVRSAHIQAASAERSAQIQAQGSRQNARYALAGTLITGLLVLVGTIYTANKKVADESRKAAPEPTAAAHTPGRPTGCGLAGQPQRCTSRRSVQPFPAPRPPHRQPLRPPRTPSATPSPPESSPLPGPKPSAEWTVVDIDGTLLTLDGAQEAGRGQKLLLKSGSNGRALAKVVACQVRNYPICALTQPAQSNLRKLGAQVLKGDVFLVAF